MTYELRPITTTKQTLIKKGDLVHLQSMT